MGSDLISNIPKLSHIVLYFFSIFLVLIESIRRLIRPLTLMIRIRANITAGHLLIVLVSRFFVKLDLGSGWLLFMGNIGLRLLESMVIFVQAYVFVILLRL